MTAQRSFVRKITYFSLIGLLLFPLYWLSLPATTRSEGGKLAQIRKEYNLSQAKLGEIDPTSATMKLATFGLDGVAVSILWSTAIDAKEREDWTTFSAALEQIMNLQPHFVRVWQFQAHNVSFNISYEFDDYHDRYHYVIKGIELLERGIRYNQLNPRILRDLAHFIEFKIGKSDESDLYRPMFRNDKNFHGTDRMAGTRYAGRDPKITDNWMLSKWWFKQADDLLDFGLASYQSMSPEVIHADAPHMQIQYAKSLEEDGHFDKSVSDEWKTAISERRRFGARDLRTGMGYSIRLSDYQKQRQATIDLKKKFDEIVATEPDVLPRLLKERGAAITAEHRKAVNTAPNKRTEKQQALAEEAERKALIQPRDLALAMNDKHRDEALQTAESLQAARSRLAMIEKKRDTVNYEYWKVRCDVENREDTIDARRAIYEADQLYAAGDLKKALDRYNNAIQSWAKVVTAYPGLLDEKTMIIELRQIVAKYQRILAQTDTPEPKPFPLQSVIDSYEVWRSRGEVGPVQLPRRR